MNFQQLAKNFTQNPEYRIMEMGKMMLLRTQEALTSSGGSTASNNDLDITTIIIGIALIFVGLPTLIWSLHTICTTPTNTGPNNTNNSQLDCDDEDAPLQNADNSAPHNDYDAIVSDTQLTGADIQRCCLPEKISIAPYTLALGLFATAGGLTLLAAAFTGTSDTNYEGISNSSTGMSL